MPIDYTKNAKQPDAPATWGFSKAAPERVDVVFTLESGENYVMKNVIPDSVGPGAEPHGVIGVEFFGSDRVVHVPFVRSWEFIYH